MGHYAHVGISHGSASSNISDDSGHRKVSAICVPLLLTKDQKQIVLPGAKDVSRYRTEEDDFLKHIVIYDKTFVHHHIPETKQANMECGENEERHRGNPRLVFLLGQFLQRFFGIAEAYCTLTFSKNGVQLLRTTANCLMKQN